MTEQLPRMYTQRNNPVNTVRSPFANHRRGVYKNNAEIYEAASRRIQSLIAASELGCLTILVKHTSSMIVGLSTTFPFARLLNKIFHSA
jgi:hypothetical protein